MRRWWSLRGSGKSGSLYGTPSRRPISHPFILPIQVIVFAHKFTAPPFLSTILQLTMCTVKSPAYRRMPAVAISASEAECGTRSLIDKRSIFFPLKLQTPREQQAQLSYCLRLATRLSSCRPLQLQLPPPAKWFWPRTSPMACSRKSRKASRLSTSRRTWLVSWLTMTLRL